MSTQKTIYLTPPQLTAEHIQEKITCIRAHRERIFNTSTQIIYDKLICHNYGQGGAGWTFLFGCVNESIRQFENQLKIHHHYKNKPVCVIGAGCYGLLTAITLARAGYAVRIVAQDVHSITSYKSAGFFFPRWRKCSNAAEIDTFLLRGIESYETYLSIIRGTHPFITYGPKLLPTYYSLDIDPGFGPYIEQGLMNNPTQVMISFGAQEYAAYEYTSIFVNSSVIMQELQRNVAALQIPIHIAFVNEFSDISEPIIFNCAGLGAKQLNNDARIVPVQGHLITLKNQPIESLQYMLNFKVVQKDQYGTRDELIYFAPKDSGILGVTFKRGENSLTTNQHEFDRLLQRTNDFFTRT